MVLPLHGPHGEDGTMQGLLELFKLPYVRSGVLGSAVAMDKAIAKRVTEQAGIPQCRWIEFRDGIDDAREIVGRAIEALGPPLFVKPAQPRIIRRDKQGATNPNSDKAIDVALRYDDTVIIEEAVTAREIEVAVLGQHSPETSVPGEILPGSDFYDYEDKYVTGAAKLAIPADLPAEEIARRELAVESFPRAALPSLARVDFFYEEGGRGWLLNEINTIPGYPRLDVPKLWDAAGLGYADLIDRLVVLALENHRRRAGFSTEH